MISKVAFCWTAYPWHIYYIRNPLSTASICDYPLFVRPKHLSLIPSCIPITTMPLVQNLLLMRLLLMVPCSRSPDLRPYRPGRGSRDRGRRCPAGSRDDWLQGRRYPGTGHVTTGRLPRRAARLERCQAVRPMPFFSRPLGRAGSVRSWSVLNGDHTRCWLRFCGAAYPNDARTRLKVGPYVGLSMIYEDWQTRE